MLNVQDDNYDFRMKTLNQNKIIELNKDNLIILKSNPILFIEDSNDGEIFLMDNKCNIYHIALGYNEFVKKEDIYVLLPKYKTASYKNQTDYIGINLGMGHALCIDTEIYNNYMKVLKENTTYENQYEDCYNAYCYWMDCAIKFLNRK